MDELVVHVGLLSIINYFCSVTIVYSLFHSLLESTNTRPASIIVAFRIIV
jgi:hypothetical protein